MISINVLWLFYLNLASSKCINYCKNLYDINVNVTIIQLLQTKTISFIIFKYVKKITSTNIHENNCIFTVGGYILTS